MTTISEERLAQLATSDDWSFEVASMASELQSARVTIREQAERIAALDRGHSALAMHARLLEEQQAKAAGRWNAAGDY